MYFYLKNSCIDLPVSNTSHRSFDFRTSCTSLGIRLKYERVQDHSNIGYAERSVARLKSSLRNLTSETEEHWHKHVAHINFHLNQSVHST